MCWNNKGHCFIHSRSGLYLRQWDMRVFSYTVPFSQCLYSFRFLVTGPYFWRFYWLATIQYQVTQVHMLIWTLSVLTFTVPYPAHSKLVFMHAFCLTFPVSILSRAQVVSHPFFQQKRNTFRVSRRTSEFTVTTFDPDTTSSEAHWTFVRPDNYTYRQEVGLGWGETRGGVQAT